MTALLEKATTSFKRRAPCSRPGLARQMVGLAFRTDTGQVALGGGLDLVVWFAIK